MIAEKQEIFSTAGSAFDVFLSHSSADLKAVNRLHKRLEKYSLPKKISSTSSGGASIKKRKLKVFHYMEDAPLSNSLRSSMENIISEIDKLIICVSKDSLINNNVLFEIESFLKYHSSSNFHIVLVNDFDTNKYENVIAGLFDDEPVYLDIKFANCNWLKWVLFYKWQFNRRTIPLLGKLFNIKPQDLVDREKKRRKNRLILSSCTFLLIAAAFFGLYKKNEIEIDIERKNAEINYANSLAYKSGRFIEEKRYGAAAVLLTKAKSLTQTSEIFSASLQLPTSLFISDTTVNLPFNSLNNLKSNKTGDVIVGTDNNQELLYYSLNNSSTIKIPNLKYPRIKSFFFRNKEFWTINDLGIGIKIDSSNIKHEVFSIPSNPEDYDIDVRFFNLLPNEKEALLALHSGSIYIVKNNDLELLQISKPNNNAALEDVVIDFANQYLIVAWSGGLINFYRLNDWTLEKTINTNDWLIDNAQSMYHPRMLIDNKTLLVSADGGESKLFALPLNTKSSELVNIDISENTNLDFENGLVKLNPTKNQVAIVSNTSIITYSTENGSLIKVINANTNITTFKYDLSGKYIIIPYSSDKLGVFDSISGELVELVDGFPESITGISLSENRSIIVSMEKGLIRSLFFYKIPDYYSFNNTIQFINLNSTISSKGNLIAMPVPPIFVPENGQQIMILDSYSGNLVSLIENSAVPQSKNEINVLIFNQNDDFLLAYSNNLGVAIWDIRKEPKLIVPWKKLNIQNIKKIYFNPREGINFSCVTNGVENKVFHFEVKNNELLKIEGTKYDNYIDLALSLYSKKYTVPKQLLNSSKDIINFKYNSNGSISFICKNILYIWNPKNGDFNKIIFDSDFNLSYRKFDVSNDGKYVAYITPKSSRDVNIYLCEIKSGKNITIRNPNLSIYKNKIHKDFGLIDIKFSENSESIFTLSQKNIIQHWGLFSPSSNENATKLTGLKMDETEVILSFD